MKKKTNNEDSSDYDEIRSFPLYGALIGGIIIILCGIFIHFTKFNQWHNRTRKIWWKWNHQSIA